MTGLVALVALEGATSAFDKLYTYAVPPELHSVAKAGCRALVPFGRGNIKKQCMKELLVSNRHLGTAIH